MTWKEELDKVTDKACRAF